MQAVPDYLCESASSILGNSVYCLRDELILRTLAAQHGGCGERYHPAMCLSDYRKDGRRQLDLAAFLLYDLR